MLSKVLNWKIKPGFQQAGEGLISLPKKGERNDKIQSALENKSFEQTFNIIIFLSSRLKVGHRGGAKPYAAQSVSLLQSDSTELKNPISALQVPD